MEIDNFYLTSKENEDLSPKTNLTSAIVKNCSSCEKKIYYLNIEQKVSNSVTLPFVRGNYETSFSNFTYDNEPRYFIFIVKSPSKLHHHQHHQHIKDSFTITIYDTITKIINETFTISLTHVKDYPYNTLNFTQVFELNDNRNSFKKALTNISFLHLNQKTNTLYYNNNTHLLIIISLDRKHYIHINTRTKQSFYFTTQDIITSLTNLHLQLQRSQITNDIPQYTINSSNVFNLQVDMDMFVFGKNYYALIYEDIIYFIMYINNDLNYDKYLMIIAFDLCGGCYIMEKTIEINIRHYNVELSSLIVKAVKDKYKRLIMICGLSFNNNYFEVILINIDIKVYKRFTSNEFFRILMFNDSNKKPKVKEFNVITDIFIYEHQGFCFIIINFINIITININTFSLVMWNSKKESNININYSGFCLRLDKIFKNEYNKVIYLSLDNVYNDGTHILELHSKKEVKYLRFINQRMKLNEKETQLSFNFSFIYNQFMIYKGNYTVFEMKHIKMNLSCFYKWLLLYAKTNIFSNIDSLIHIKEEVKYNFNYVIKHNVYDISMIHLINYTSQCGVFCSFYKMVFNTFRYEHFHKYLYFTNIESIHYDKYTPIILYKVTLNNLFQFELIILYLFKYFIAKGKIDKQQMYIIMKGIFTQHERGIIYQCIQKLLMKMVMRKEKIIKYKNSLLNNSKNRNNNKKIQLFMQLRKAINSSNLDIVFMIIHKHYK